jgi:hypothetical protein
MLGSPCSPCCAAPAELIEWSTNNAQVAFSSVRTQRGAVFNWAACGTKSSVTSTTNPLGYEVVNCSSADCPTAYLVNTNTGSYWMTAVVRVPSGSGVTVTLSGTTPSDSYTFAGIKSLSAADAISLGTSSQWEAQYTPELQWNPMPYRFAASAHDSSIWATTSLYAWPCGSLGTIVPIYSLYFQHQRSGLYGIEIMSGTEKTTTSFQGRTVCSMDDQKKIDRQCCEAVEVSRSIQYTATDDFSMVSWVFRRNGFHARKHALALTLSW